MKTNAGYNRTYIRRPGPPKQLSNPQEMRPKKTNKKCPAKEAKTEETKIKLGD